MRRIRVIGALIAALFVVAVVSSPAKSSVHESVWPIAGVNGNFCTASSINEANRMWLTAAHCVDMGGMIMGDEITVIEVDVLRDVAIVQTPRVSAPALRMAAVMAPVCETVEDVDCRVMVVGYPFGFPQQVTTIGTVAAWSVDVSEEGDEATEEEPVPFALFNVTGAPGNSGSAIVNRKGEVVSILQIGWGRTFAPMVGGVVFETLAEYRGYFTGAKTAPDAPIDVMQLLIDKLLSNREVR